jgi:hypothetical protein
VLLREAEFTFPVDVVLGSRPAATLVDVVMYFVLLAKKITNGLGGLGCKAACTSEEVRNLLVKISITSSDSLYGLH